MASRSDLLEPPRHRRLQRPGVDGVLGTPDILDDLLLLGALEGKVVIGSMNRGGLQGASFELDDRFTAYRAARDRRARPRRRQDADAHLPRRPRHGRHPRGQRPGRHRARRASGSWRWSSRSSPSAASGRVVNLLDPDSTIKSIHIAAGLGASSAYTWLKLPVVDDLDRVMDATTLPTLLLGGDPQGDPQDTYASLGRAPSTCPPCAASSSAAPCSTRPTATSPRPSTSPPSSVHGSGAAMSDNERWVRPLGTADDRRAGTVAIDDARRRLAAHRACMPAGWPRARAASVAGRGVGARRRAALGLGRPSRQSTPRARARGDAGGPGRRCSPGPTDVAYVPATASCHGDRRGRAGPGRARAAPARPRGPGAGVPPRRRRRTCRSSCAAPAPPAREVRNFGIPGVLDADSIIACEVITPAGNWCSYPPHKHDEERDGRRDRARGDLLLRGRRPTAGRPARRGRGPGRLPAGLRHRRAPDRRARRGAHRRRRARPPRLARAGDGRARATTSTTST